jgi:Glycosyltransferase family 92
MAQKFGLSILAIVRNEGRYLLEWVAFHRVVGVEHFFIYDNESTDETTDVLLALERAGIVTRIAWTNEEAARIDPTVGPQLPAYKDFLHYKDRTQWVAVVDADEFIVPNGMQSIQALLSVFPGAAALGINWRVFGSGGQTTYRDEPVTRRFLQRAPDTFSVNRHVKSITRTDTLRSLGIHMAELREGVAVDTYGNEIDPACAGIHANPGGGLAQVNHYVVKSSEEWTAKKLRGRAGWGPTDAERFRREEVFRHHDRNDVTDGAALYWYSRTCEEMTRLARLLPPQMVAGRGAAWGQRTTLRPIPGLGGTRIDWDPRWGGRSAASARVPA